MTYPLDDAAQPRGHLVADNAETIAAVNANATRDIGRHQLAIEHVTAVLGRPRSIYVVLTGVTVWTTLNVALSFTQGGAVDPPPFFWLQGVIGLGALVTAVMVLTTQNRQTHHAEQRAHLDLQVNLAAEQKTAKIIALLEELRRDLPDVRDRRDPIADAMSEAVDPHAVMSAMEDTFEVDEPEP